MDNYNDILQRMKNTYSDLSGYDIDENSDIGIKIKVLANEIYSLQSNIQWLKNQMFPITATDIQLDKHAEQKGISRKSAVKAKGILTFSRETELPYDIEIPKDTICSLANDTNIKYVTTEDAVLTSGTLSVDVPAEAILGGSMYNTAKNTITLMIIPPVSITAVTNNNAFSGGLDTETDDELRKRLSDLYKNVPNSVNAVFYKNFVMSYEGVYSAKVKFDNNIINIYVGGKGDVVSNDTIAKIQNDIENIRPLNTQITIHSAEPAYIDYGIYITIKDGYVFDNVATECRNVISKYINSIGVGECIYLVDIGNALYNINGILNYSFNSVYSNDYQLEDGQFGICNNIYISQRG